MRLLQLDNLQPAIGDEMRAELLAAKADGFAWLGFGGGGDEFAVGESLDDKVALAVGVVTDVMGELTGSPSYADGEDIFGRRTYPYHVVRADERVKFLSPKSILSIVLSVAWVLQLPKAHMMPRTRTA